MKTLALLLIFGILIGCSKEESTTEKSSPNPEVEKVSAEQTQRDPPVQKQLSKEKLLQAFLRKGLPMVRKEMGYIKSAPVGPNSFFGSYIPENAEVEVQYHGGNTAQWRIQTVIEQIMDGKRTGEKVNWGDWRTVYFNDGIWQGNDPSKSTFRLNE